MNKETILETAITCGIGAVQARRLIIETSTRTKHRLGKTSKLAGAAAVGAGLEYGAAKLLGHSSGTDEKITPSERILRGIEQGGLKGGVEAWDQNAKEFVDMLGKMSPEEIKSLGVDTW